MSDISAKDLFSDSPQIWPADLLPKALQTEHLKGILSVASPVVLVTTRDHTITAKKILSRAAKLMGNTMGWHRHCDVCKAPTIKISKEPMVCASCRVKIRDVIAVSECATCKKEIRRRFCAYVYKVKNADVASFCSKACHGKWNTLHKLKPEPCVACGKSNKTIQGKYCSRNCSDGSKRTRVGKPIKCTLCGDIFTGKTYPRKSCSDECSRRLRAIHASGERCNFWRGGPKHHKTKVYYPQNFRNKVRKDLIRKRDLYGCAICRVKPANLRHLFIHHIDWVKTNSRINNLICLCSSCHAKGHNDHSKLFFDNDKLIHLAQSRTKRMPKAWKVQLAAIDARYDDDGKLNLYAAGASSDSSK